MQPPHTRPAPLLTPEANHYPRSVVLVGGSVRAAAADAQRAGYQVIAVDRFGDRDLIPRCEQWLRYAPDHNWMTKLAELPSIPIVPVGGFSWPMASELTVERQRFLSSRLIAYPAPETLKRINAPSLQGEIAEKNGAMFPETRQLVGGVLETVFQPSVTSAMESDRWIVKPEAHAGGVDIRFATDSTQFTQGQFLQRKVKGLPIGANFLCLPAGPKKMAVNFLGAFGGLTYRSNPAHPFLYGGSFGPLKLEEQVTETLQKLGEACANAFQLVGLFNLDLILGLDKSLVLLEINPRYSASMELIGLNTGSNQSRLSLIDWHITAYQAYQNQDGCDDCLNQKFQDQYAITETALFCKRIIYAKHQTTIISELESICLRVGGPTSDDTASYLCDIPDNEAIVGVGEPICTVITARTADLQAVIRRSAQCARMVRRTCGAPFVQIIEGD